MFATLTPDAAFVPLLHRARPVRNVPRDLGIITLTEAVEVANAIQKDQPLISVTLPQDVVIVWQDSRVTFATNADQVKASFSSKSCLWTTL